MCPLHPPTQSLQWCPRLCHSRSRSVWMKGSSLEWWGLAVLLENLISQILLLSVSLCWESEETFLTFIPILYTAKSNGSFLLSKFHNLPPFLQSKLNYHHQLFFTNHVMNLSIFWISADMKRNLQRISLFQNLSSHTCIQNAVSWETDRPHYSCFFETINRCLLRLTGQKNTVKKLTHQINVS